LVDHGQVLEARGMQSEEQVDSTSHKNTRHFVDHPGEGKTPKGGPIAVQAERSPPAMDGIHAYRLPFYVFGGGPPLFFATKPELSPP
jgi:hypothetical protein